MPSACIPTSPNCYQPLASYRFVNEMRVWPASRVIRLPVIFISSSLRIFITLASSIGFTTSGMLDITRERMEARESFGASVSCA